MSEATNTENVTIPEAVHEITESSKEMLASGERIAANLDALERRAEHAFDLRAQVSEKPWIVPVAAILGGILLWRIFR